MQPDPVKMRQAEQDHRSWRMAMGRVWDLYPRMVFFTHLDNDLISLGGFVRDNPQACNDDRPP